MTESSVGHAIDPISPLAKAEGAFLALAVGDALGLASRNDSQGPGVAPTRLPLMSSSERGRDGAVDGSSLTRRSSAPESTATILSSHSRSQGAERTTAATGGRRSRRWSFHSG